MVKIKGFDGFIFKPELYEQFLHKNIEYIEECQLLQNFNTEEYISKGLLQSQNNQYIYIYEQQFLQFVTIGLLAQLSLLQYGQKKIKKHEKTLVRPHLNQDTYGKDHVGPVIVGHEHFEPIDNALNQYIINSEPFAVWKTVDGRKHKLWRVSSFDRLIQSFKNIQNFYILDGHHRFQAAYSYLQKLGENAKQKNKWIQGLVYSTKYIRTYPQFRKLIHQKNESIIRNLKLNQKLIVTQLNEFDHKEHEQELVLLQDGKYYSIRCVQDYGRPISKTGVQKLDQILRQAFDQISEKSQQPIKFIPSIMFDLNKTQLHKHPIFLVKSPPISEIFSIANQDQFLPPKSTWLEPKPCLHMVIRLPY